MASSTTHSAASEAIGDSDAFHIAKPERRSLVKREQKTISSPQGSPRSHKSDFSTQSTTSSAASFDLAGRIMAFEAAHTVLGQNGEKNHGAGSPMHRRNRSDTAKKIPFELKDEKRDDSDHKFNATLNDETLSTITKAESGKFSNADKESVVSSASRISSLSQKILQAQNTEKASSSANNDRDSVVSSASRISSLSQKMLHQISIDDKDSEDSIMLSANLIASLSQKILEKQNEKGSTDTDSVLSSAALITSLSQRILQSRQTAPATPASAKSRPSFKSRSSRSSRNNNLVEKVDEHTRSFSSRTSRTSFERMEEITNGDKESVTSSVSQISSVSQRIKALEKNSSSSFTNATSAATSPRVSPRTSFSSALQPPNRSPYSKTSTTATGIDAKSMSRIQDRIRAMQKADVASTISSSQRPPRPSFSKRLSSRSNPNPQDPIRPLSPPSTEPAMPVEASSSVPTETVMEVIGSHPNNISGITMDSTGTDANSTTTPAPQLTLQNVSELSALPDPALPPSVHRFASVERPTPSKPSSHVSLPNPIAHAMDAMRQYYSPFPTSPEQPSNPRWFPQEHFAIANALFPEHQFGVNDATEPSQRTMRMMESQSLPPPMRARSHSEGDKVGLDDHGFPKFLSSQREPNDKVPHHIQFTDDWSSSRDEDDRRRRRARNEAPHNRWKELVEEMMNYNWKDKLPIVMGCLLIFIGIIVGIHLAVSGGEEDLVNFDMDMPPSAELCNYVEQGYSIPGEDQFWEVDLNWLLDVSLEDPSKSKSRLSVTVQQLFQKHVIPALVGCGSSRKVLEGQYLIANGYAWTVRDIGNCEAGTPLPCSKLLVSFVLWTKAYRDPEAMNGFTRANFAMSKLMEPLEEGYNIRSVNLVKMELKV